MQRTHNNTTHNTRRLFKLPGLLEDHCEEYGQSAAYKGTIPGQEDACEFGSVLLLATLILTPLAYRTASLL